MPYEKRWTGDKGETHLRMGTKTSKSAPRVEAYGTIDELNSFIGMALAATDDPSMQHILEEIQKDLFSIGADLSTPLYEKIRRVDAARNLELERLIKDIDTELDDLKHFILPGGTKAAALLQACRTICRRAERRIVALKEQEGINEEILRYVNRLADVLFQLARLANKRNGVHEKIWKG